MSLYAIGDLHLSLTAEKPMDVFGGAWEGYIGKIEEGLSMLSNDDVLVICGDLTWGKDLKESKEDFLFLAGFPGKKIILKGNHDYYWSTVGKMTSFLSGIGVFNISFLHNNSYSYESVSFGGTRGWFFEEEFSKAENEKVYRRELLRLEASLKTMDSGTSERFCFLHYPPLYGGTRASGILDILKRYKISRCYYGHLHGHSRRLAFEGKEDGIEYRLISADHLNFKPLKII